MSQTTTRTDELQRHLDQIDPELPAAAQVRMLKEAVEMLLQEVKDLRRKVDG